MDKMTPIDDIFKPLAGPFNPSHDPLFAARDEKADDSAELETQPDTDGDETPPQPIQTKSKKRPASTHSPLIQAILKELFTFPSQELAEERLRQIRSQYITVEAESSDDSIMLWIRGLGVTPDLDKKGYMGNFARIFTKTRDDGMHTLSLEQIDVPLSDHPSRKRQKFKHPNWAHPVLSKVRKEHIYESVETARQDLQKLHVDYPDTSIPASEDKLYIIVYDKSENRWPPIRKIILEVENTAKGIIINWFDNNNGRKGGGSKKSTQEAVAAAAMATITR